MVDIPEGWIDRDKARAVPFVEVLGALGLLDRLKAKGSNLQGPCPIGKEHGKADCFGVEIGAKQAYNCFACKSKGNVIDFVMAYKGVPFKEAATWLVELAEQGSADVAEVAAEAPLDVEHAPLTAREEYLIACAVERALLRLSRAAVDAVHDAS